MGLLGVLVLFAGVIGVPGLIYKFSKAFLRRRGLPDELRVRALAVLTLVGTVVCFLLSLPHPVPLTVAAILLGNVSLVLLRHWLNVSAHVSVLTFAVLWFVLMYGQAWLWLLVLSPVMLWSRVSLGEHTREEALAGAALGLATFCCFLGATTWS